jgi:hypothetical protein
MQLWQVLARFLQSGKPVTLRTMAIAGCTGVGVGMIVAYIMMGTIHSVRPLVRRYRHKILQQFWTCQLQAVLA